MKEQAGIAAAIPACFYAPTFFILSYRTAAADVLLILFPVGMVGQLCPMLMDVFLVVEVAAVGGLLHSQTQLVVRPYMHAGQQISAKSHDLFRQDFSFRYFKTCSLIDIDIVPEREAFMRKAKTGNLYWNGIRTKKSPAVKSAGLNKR